MLPGKAMAKTRKVRVKSSRAHRTSGSEEPVSLRPGLSFPVVVIGASAGGLAAFTELLKALPAKSGMAFVLLQHLEPKHESALTTLLSKATSMPVVEVSDGMAVEQNRIYVIPPNKDMTIREGTLQLAPRSTVSGPQRPIDDFSITLAEQRGNAAIGVVLSGTGSDGSDQLKAVKAAGGVLLDLDLIYRALDEAQKSDDYSRAIVDTIHEALAVVDSEFRVLTVNRSFCELFRVTLENTVGQPFFEVGNGQWDIPGLRKLFGHILPRSARVRDFEIGQEFPKIGRRELTLNARKIETSKTILIAIEDFTERKRAEKEAQQSAATIRSLIDSAPQSVIAVSPDETIVLANGNVEKMFGYHPSELIGRRLDVLVPENFRARHVEHEKAYFINMQTRPMGVGLTLEARRKDGTLFPVEIGLSAIETAAGKLAVAFVSDITQRKRMEDALRHREQEINTVLDDNPDVILRLNREFHYTYVNAKTASVAGIPREAFIGKTPGEVGLPQDLIDLWRPHTLRALETGQPSVLDFSYPSPGGATEWEERFIPEFARDGSVESILCIGRDVTERNRLQRITKTDSQQIRALATSLLTAQEEERRRVSRELHDQICQQLAALAIDIGGLAENPPNRKEALNQMKALQARAVQASEQARHLAYELHPSMLDDLGLVASMRSLCKDFSNQNPEIYAEFVNADMPASISREVASCVYRAAQESLQNIAKHAQAKHVSIALRAESNSLVLTITDDGAGFEVEAAKGRGGLGLIGVEERARLLNGTFTVSAQPGRGTSVTLTVPLGDQQP